MKIYILNNDNMVSFSLPKKIEGSFILNNYVNNIKDDLITIEAQDGKWVAHSNDAVKIKFNNEEVEKITLQYYMFYQLVIYETQIINIYILPVYDEKYLMKMVSDNSRILIGSDSKADIVISFLKNQQIELKYENKRWSIQNLDVSIPVYINSIRKNQSFLNSFDIVFILGVKLICVGPHLFITNPNNCLLNFSNVFIPPKYEYVIADYNSNGRVYKDFYEEKEYFVKSPVFQNKIETVQFQIADPPSIQRSKSGSILMQIVPSAAMSIASLLSLYYTVKRYNSGESDKETYLTSLVMCIIMLFTGILWPFIQSGYEKLIDALTVGKNKRSYKKYLKKKKQSINDVRLKTKLSLKDVYIDLEECVKVITQRNPHLFSVGLDNNRFLTVRLGIGTIKFDAIIKYEKPEFSVEPNKLYNDVDKMLEEVKYIDDAPVTISLKEKKVISFINKADIYKYDYIKYLLLQLVTFHSPSDLKIVILTDDIHKQEYDYFKNINHCWDDDRSIRFFASNISEARYISSYLESIFIARSGADKQENIELSKDYSPYYLVICDSIKIYRDISIVRDIINFDSNFGFSLAIFEEKLNNIPSKCVHFVDYNSKEGTCFESEMEENTIEKFSSEFVKSHLLVNYDENFLKLSNIPIKSETQSSKDLPSKLGFLEMYGVGRVELLNSENRWKVADVVNTLAAPIGIDANGDVIDLDLHEKRHGPHGLIAGMTGSGKSEFIVTYILSMAVNYSPKEVQFVLIDYKGGGLAGAFENRQKNIRLPHLVGTITNLDKSEMDRTLASIQSELQRRQKVFNKVKEELDTGTIDIYKYQQLYREGKISESMSHLFIISDEFAELKSQQPDFMDQLVSAARIGRSLGIHLILATQKPSGVVDDQIWSNAKFKVCCKVQTVEDSREMLGKPDAASLKDAGRFYLQVGYDIYYMLGQSAYSGSKYIPTNKISSNIDNKLNLINDMGEVLFTTEKQEKVEGLSTDKGEELTNILKYLISVADSNEYQTKNLWLDNIPDHIYLANIKSKYSSFIKNERGIINPVIGEYDDPKNQKQGIVTLPITNGGNCIIYGISGSGKTTFLSTLILSAITCHTTREVKFYIIDYGNEALKKFENAPQVGNVLTMDNADKVEVLLNRISNEMKKRRRILAKEGVDYLTYVKSNKGSMPNYIVIINGFDAFKEQFDDFISYDFMAIIRDCNKYGITLIISCTTTASLSGVQKEQFSQTVCLKLNDIADYMDIFDTAMVPKNNPGRGLIQVSDEVYQFQTALIADNQNLDTVLNTLFRELSKITYKADGIPIMPDNITANLFSRETISLNSVPVGYNKDTIETSYYDFDRYLSIIIASKGKYLKSFVQGLALLISKIQKTKVIILDGTQTMKLSNLDKIKYYDSGFSKLLPFLRNNINKYDCNTENRIVIFINGYENIEEHLKKYYEENGEDEGVTLNDLISESLSSNLYRFIICGTYTNNRKFENESWFNSMPKRDGIVIFDTFNDQDVVVAKRLSDEYSLQLDETNAFVVRNNEKEIISYISE